MVGCGYPRLHSILVDVGGVLYRLNLEVKITVKEQSKYDVQLFHDSYYILLI